MECVSDDHILPLDISSTRVMRFYIASLAHDVFGVECLVGQILVICMYYNLMFQNDVSDFFTHLYC